MAVNGIARIVWNTGEESSLRFRISTNPLGRGAELGGTVTQGPLTGSRIVASPIVVAVDGLCLFGGVKSFSANYGFDTFIH